MWLILPYAARHRFVSLRQVAFRNTCWLRDLSCLSLFHRRYISESVIGTGTLYYAGFDCSTQRWLVLTLVFSAAFKGLTSSLPPCTSLMSRHQEWHPCGACIWPGGRAGDQRKASRSRASTATRRSSPPAPRCPSRASKEWPSTHRTVRGNTT